MRRDDRRSTAARARSLPVLAFLALLIGGLLSLGAEPALGQQGAVTGQVTSAETGQPLSGVQIVVVGTQQGGLTDAEGRYRVTGVPAGEHQVRARLIGYTSSTVSVTVQSGQTATADFSLTRSAVDMEEIVVTGQAGAARRREIGNSVQSIDAQQIDDRPVNSMQDILQGSTQGLAVLPNSGQAGAGATLRLRGANSITQSNEPLIYVDGIRVDNGYYGNYKANLNPVGAPNQSSRPLQDINPANIERIEVIKGSAATTLYGTEASSGVIQIFTKSGAGLERNTTRWNVNLTGGVSHLPTMWPERKRPGQAWFDRYGPESKGMWVDMWKDNGSSVDATVSITRQAEDVNTYVSGRYQKEESVLPVQGMNAYNLQGNLGLSPAPGLRIQFTNLVNQRNVDWVSAGNEAEGFMLNVMRGPRGYTGSDLLADSVVLDQEYDDNQTHWVSSVTVNYQPVTQFNAKLTLGYDFLDTEQIETIPFGHFFAPGGSRFNQRIRNETRTMDFRVNYREEILGGITTNTATGFEVFQSFRKTVSAKAEGFAGPHSPTLTSGSDRNVVEDRLEEVQAGWYFQERFGFADKLFLTGGVRADGNSAFGDRNEVQFYPSASFSYMISEEDFWPEFFDQTKLRGAVGQSGKAPGFFDADRVWRPVIRGEDRPAVTPDNRGNPDLGPERTTEFEAGIETSMLDGRLGFNGSVYRQTTTDALVPVRQDPTRGFMSPQLRNIGEISSSGFELTLDGTPVERESFSWSSSATLSYNTSEVQDLGDAPPVFLGDNTWAREGFPLAGYFGDQVANPNERAEPEFTSNTFIGPSIPEWTGSFSTTLNLGDRITVRGMGEYQGGFYVQSEASQFSTSRLVWPPCLEAQLAMQEGNRDQLTAFQRAHCDPNINRVATHHYEADFFRVREASISYRMPESLTPGNFESFRVRLSGTNLALFTDYKGIDPEMNELYAGGSTLNNRQEYYQVPPHPHYLLTLNFSF